MELKQLEYFCRIADAGSIHEAARRMHMSQPPLSYQLHQLEEELGVRLLERTRRGVELTAAGKLLYARAGSLLSYARSTQREVAAAGTHPVLRLGITSTTVDLILPAIARFAQRCPQVRFEVHDGASYTLLQYLLDGILDVSVARTPLRLEEVHSAVLGSEPMIAAFPPSQGPEPEAQLKLEALTQRPLILYRRYEELIREAFHSRGLQPEILCVCDDARDAALWVRAGLATAIFPQSMRGQCTGVQIRTLDEPQLTTQAVLIWRKNERPAAVVRDFLEVCVGRDLLQPPE